MCSTFCYNDDYTHVLQLIIGLQQPFHALLLGQHPNGESRRITSEQDIIVPGIEHQINFAKDIRTEVVEVL